MTVCIAALADNKKKAILVADKLLTSRGALSYQVTSDNGKIFEICEGVKVAWSGGRLEAVTILENAKKSLGSKKFVKDVAEHINQKHLEYLKDVLERTHLTPRSLKSIAEFYKTKELNVDPDTRKYIDTALTTHTLGSFPKFIVCGKDTDEAYKIFILDSNPRNIIQPQLDGYGAIGSGELHARFSIIHSPIEYKQSLSLDKVKEIVLEAKRKSEKDSDVGTDTDMVLME